MTPYTLISELGRLVRYIKLQIIHDADGHPLSRKEVSSYAAEVLHELANTYQRRYERTRDGA